MGTAIDTVGVRIGASVTFPTAVTVNSGDSLVVRNFPDATHAYLEEVWGAATTSAKLRIRSPRMHDFVQNINLRVRNDALALLPDDAREPVYAQDPLTVEAGGTGGTEAAAFALVFYYQDLPGVAARLDMPNALLGRVEHLIGQEVAVTSNAIAGEWGPGVAINSTFDTFKVDRDYALFGVDPDVALVTCAIRGTDTGNLRVGAPGTINRREGRDWFVKQSQAMGTPHVAVVNSANRGATLVDVQAAAASVAANVVFIMGLLAA